MTKMLLVIDGKRPDDISGLFVLDEKDKFQGKTWTLFRLQRAGCRVVS